MPKIFILSLILCFMLTVSATLDRLFINRALDSSGASVSSDGIVPLTGPGTFVVSAGLDYNSTTNTSASSVNMLLSLYTSNSLLASNCMGFTSFKTSQHLAEVTNSTSNATFMNFNAQGNSLDTSLVLSSAYWSLNSNGMLAKSCSTSGVSFVNTSLWGIIGLGFADNSSRNYVNNEPLFSIFIEEDGNSGELLFFSNLTKATTSTPIASLASDSNWQIGNLTNIVLTGDNPQTINISAYGMFFDLNSDAIGFPSDLYSTVINSIQQTGENITCNTDIYLPKCNYTGNIDDLPTLEISSGNSTCPIYPEVYIANASQYNGQINGEVTLNFKEISSSLNGSNYVSPNYNDYIIMDVHVLTYFYIVFAANSTQPAGTISVYIANHNSPSVLKSSPVLYIVLGIVIILLLAGAAYWFFVRRGKQVYEEEKEPLKENRSLLEDETSSQL